MLPLETATSKEQAHAAMPSAITAPYVDPLSGAPRPDPSPHPLNAQHTTTVHDMHTSAELYVLPMLLMGSYPPVDMLAESEIKARSPTAAANYYLAAR